MRTPSLPFHACELVLVTMDGVLPKVVPSKKAPVHEIDALCRFSPSFIFLGERRAYPSGYRMLLSS